MLALRLVWEQTILTWNSGLQMVGFSLAHTYGLFLFLFPLMLLPWMAVALVFVIFRLVRRRPVTRTAWAMLASAIALLIMLVLPYSLWQLLFVDRLASGPNSAEFLVYASADGDLALVRELVEHGVPVNARDREGTTGLHTAAARGQLKVLNYLISRGADVNALNRYGDSPLERAASASQSAATQLIAGHGGTRIRGDEAQRQRATDEIVREDIQRLK
jgi:Ankyrin repeats (many copies)